MGTGWAAQAPGERSAQAEVARLKLGALSGGVAGGQPGWPLSLSMGTQCPGLKSRLALSL